MPGQFTFSKLTPDDASFLDEMLYQAIFTPEGDAPPPREVTQHPALRRYVGGFGAQPGDMGYKATDQHTGQDIGAAWVRLLQGDNQGYGYINDSTPELSMAVVAAYRGQGIGSRLLEHVLDAARGKYPAISLSVWPNNPAYRLYQRYGFEVVQAETEGGAVTMLKRL